MRSSSNSDINHNKFEGNVNSWEPREFDEQFLDQTMPERIPDSPHFDDIPQKLLNDGDPSHDFRSMNIPDENGKPVFAFFEQAQGEKSVIGTQKVTQWKFHDLGNNKEGISLNTPISIDGLNQDKEDEEKTSHFAEEQNLARTIVEGAQQKSEEIITLANLRAEQVMWEAETQRETTLQEAYQQGFAEGMEKAKENLAAVNVVFNEIKQWRDQVLAESEKTIIEMIQNIAKKLFGGGYKLDPASIEEMVGRAITEAGRLGNLRVYMNPEDQAALMSLWQESELLVNGQKIQLVSSQDIQKGGCFIEGEFGSVDSRIEAQLAIVQEKISSVQANREDEENL